MTDSVKPIGSVRPTAAQMPSRPIGSTGSVETSSISQTLRSPTTAFRGLPPIGTSDAPEKKEPQPRLSTKLSDAWSNISKYMMTYTVQRESKKFDSSYIGSFSGFSDYWSAMMKDFGAGDAKVYQTALGPQTLYEYQYRNLLSYGDIAGPARSSTFEFRDGRWWNISALRPEYKPILNVDLYAAIPSSLKSTYPTNFLPTDSELTALYHLAKKNNITEASYRDLVNTTMASKLLGASQSELEALSSVLGGGVYTLTSLPSVHSSASFNSIFGKNSPQFADFEAATKNAYDALKSLSGGLGQVALSGGMDLASIGIGALLKGVPGVVSAFINKLVGIVTGKDTSMNLSGALFADAMTLGPKLSVSIAQAISSIFSSYKGHTFHLLDSHGKPVQTWAQVDPDDRAALFGIAGALGWTRSDPGADRGKFVAGQTGISPAQLAAMLGDYFRFRASVAFTDILKAYDTFSSPTGPFGGFQVPTFYGR